jgi:hypothetical protein
VGTPKPRAAVAAAIAVAFLSGAVQAPSGSAAASCGGVKHAGHWDTITLPASSSKTSPSAVSQIDIRTYPAVAVSSRTGDITVTDAARTGLWHSADGGCTWRSSLSLSSVAGFDGDWLTNLGYQFSSVAVADPSTGQPIVYAAAVPYQGTGQDIAVAARYGSFGFAPDETTLRLFMFVSRDGGATWRQSYADSSPADLENDALHPACMNGSITVSARQPSSVFVDCARNSGDGTSVLYASSDSAAHWSTPAATSMPPTPYMPAAGFAEGLGSGATLWLPGNVYVTPKNAPPKPYVTIYRSHDRGATWQPMSLRADKVCDVNTTGWVVYTATSRSRGNVIAMWSPAALMRSANGGATWTRAIPFTSDSDPGDYEGAAVSGPGDATTYAIGGWPARATDNGTNFRPWNKDLRTRHVLLVLGDRGKWRTIGRLPAPVNSALYEMQAGWWHGAAVYGLALTPAGTDQAGFVATLLRYRP